MSVDLGSLIHEVYRQSRAKSVPPPYVTRVVKLIYLADLEWRRRHDAPLVNIEWRFLHFGPYAYDFVPLLGDPDMEVAEFEGKTARRFDFDSADLAERRVPEEPSLIVGTLVKQWGNVDLNRLLDFVYFETEPMENARRGDVLDYSMIKMLEPQITPAPDIAKIRALRARLKGQVARLGLTRDGVHISVLDYDDHRAWDEDGNVNTLPTGVDVFRDVNVD
jgi:hypothetical protein